MSGVVRVQRGATLEARSGETTVFELPIRNAVSVTVLVSTAEQVDPDYPRFVLESTDGAYRVEKTARDDLVPGDAYLQLRFERLLPGRSYTLRQLLDAERSVVVFEDLPFAEVLDRPRRPARGRDGGGGRDAWDALDEVRVGEDEE